MSKDYLSTIRENIKKRSLRNEFTKIFGLNLNEFFSNLCGFDLLGFNETIDVPDEMSIKEFVLSKYGRDGVNLIKKLIS